MNIMRRTENMVEDALRDEIRASLNDLFNRCLIILALIMMLFFSAVLIVIGPVL